MRTSGPLTLEVDLNSLEHNDRKRYELSRGESLKIKNTSTTGLGLKATIYVNGDVYIADNIENNQNATWFDPSEIGYLTIIARGDINIAPEVERIDALLVAYPRFENSNILDGNIRTCYYNYIDYSNLHFSTCDKQLVINGAVIAEKIHFGRVYGSVKLEPLPVPLPTTPATTQAAEIINLLPEYFVGVPELPLFPDQIYKTDSLSTRPANF